MIKITTHVSTPNLSRLISDFDGLVDRAVQQTAFEVERDAKLAAPVDTGALRASIFTATSKGTGQGAALSSASRVRTSRRGDQRRANVYSAGYFKPKKGQASVSVGVKYGWFVEMLHPSRKRFMTKAAWRARRALRDRIRKIINS